MFIRHMTVTVCSALLLLLVNFHSPHPCSTPANQPRPPHQLTLFICSSSVITWTLSCTPSVIKPVYIPLLSTHPWPDLSFDRHARSSSINLRTISLVSTLLALALFSSCLPGECTSLLSLTSNIACSCLPVAVWRPPASILLGEPRDSCLVIHLNFECYWHDLTCCLLCHQ